jgi:hypothetical protein
MAFLEVEGDNLDDSVVSITRGESLEVTDDEKPF